MNIFKGMFLKHATSKKTDRNTIILKTKIKEHNNLLLNATYDGQIKNTFLIFSTDDNIIVVDQHAAHEQILFESNFNNYKESKKRKIYIKPRNKISIKLSTHNYSIIKKNNHIINDLGFNISMKQNRNIELLSYLSYYNKYSLKQFINLFLKEYNSSFGLKRLKINFLKAYFQLKACRLSLKSGSSITLDQAMKIRNDLNKLTNNSHCPHGRPIMNAIPMKSLMKWFLRPNYSSGIKI